MSQADSPVLKFADSKYFYSSLGQAAEEAYRDTGDPNHTREAFDWYRKGFEATAEDELKRDADRLRQALP